ncbi:MAG: hypothetical protein H6741_28035 [Alphaproteobacteria bacterium]|nr:hypothetical protein [Alphaproteobacteria bacterium]
MTPLLLLLAADPALADDTPPVTARVLGVEDVRITLTGVQFTVIAEVERTRGLPLVVKDLNMKLTFGKLDVAETWSPEEKIKLKKGKPVEVRVPCTISAAAGLQAMNRMRQHGLPPIQLTGDAKGRVFIFPGKYSFEAEIYKPDAELPPKKGPHRR